MQGDRVCVFLVKYLLNLCMLFQKIFKSQMYFPFSLQSLVLGFFVIVK